MKAYSLRINFIWAFIGNAFAAFCKWLLLIVLTKTSTPEVVGLFGLAQAIALPINMLFSLKLQVAYVTDSQHEYAFGHYIAIKILTSLATLVTVGLIGIIFYPPATAWVIFMLGLSYAVLELREYFLSVMQKYERMDLTLFSRIGQGSLSVFLFGGLFWLTQSLAWAIFGIIVMQLTLMLTYDMPVAAKLATVRARDYSGFTPIWQREILWRLVRITAPLGITAWLMNLLKSIPRIVMDGFSGRESVGYFTAMSSLLVVGSMITAAMGQSVNPRLARYYVENRKGFVRLFIKFLAVNFFVGICLVLAAAVFGRWILTFLFTPEYAQHHQVFIYVAAAGCMLFVFSAVNSALTATRQFAVQVPIYGISVVICLVFSFILIPRFDMFGAILSIIISYVAGMSGCLFFVIKAINKPIKPVDSIIAADEQ